VWRERGVRVNIEEGLDLLLFRLNRPPSNDLCLAMGMCKLWVELGWPRSTMECDTI